MDLPTLKMEVTSLQNMTRKGVCIDLDLSDDAQTYDYIISIKGRPVGGGVITNEGMSVEMTAAKIANMAKVDRLVDMFA